MTLLQKFSVLSLILVALLSVALATLTTRLLTTHMTELEWQVTADVVRAEVIDHGIDRVFSDPALRDDPARIAAAVAPILSLPELVRVKVWDRAARVLWSDNAELIGRTFPDGAELRQALAGSVSVGVHALTKPEHASDRGRFDTVVEIYVPVTDRAGRVLGVFEVYKTPRHLSAAIARTRLVVWSVTLVGGAVLYLCLFGIVALSSRRQRVLQQDLADTRGDLDAKRVRNEELDSFVQMAAHDLKAPVVTMHGMASVLLEDHADVLDAHARHCVERLRANAEQMERLIQDLLAFSRIGGEMKSPEPVALGEVLERVLDELSEPIRRRGVTVVVGPLPAVQAVPTQIEQVLRNLIANAVKYLGDAPAPRVEIGGTERDGTVECWVSDTGVGIAPDDHERVFAVFERLRDVSAEGTGLGLPIVRKIVERAGGRIWVESARGEGATFRFTWPAAAAEASHARA